MEQKKRMFIVIAVTVLIVVAIFASFGRTLLALNTPSVVLPDLSAGIDDPTPAGSAPGTDAYQTIKVTPQTVQGVIATLYRPESYYRELSVKGMWNDGISQITVQQWQDGGWSHTRQVLPSGVIRHDLVGDGRLYYWYEGALDYHDTPADELSADLAQRLPTYETVLALDTQAIRTADYLLWGDLPCVYVEVDEAGGFLHRYWISVDHGLLLAAETEQSGSLIYQMTAQGLLQSPCPATGAFALPDGTVLHSIGAAPQTQP